MIELWGADVTELPDGDAVWQSVTELNWAETSRPLAVKVPVHRSVVDSVVALASQRSGVDLHFSAAGAVAWLLCESQDDVDELDRVLLAKEVAGLVVRGDYPRPGIGFWPSYEYFFGGEAGHGSRFKVSSSLSYLKSTACCMK